MRCVKVHASKASDIISELMGRGIVDRNAKIRRDGAFRYIPLLDSFTDGIDGCDIIDCSPYPRSRESPQMRIRKALSFLPSETLDTLPMRWEFVGDIAILKGHIPDDIREIAGKAYAKELGMKTICVDHGVSGEFRRPRMDVIFGTDTVSTRLENGIRYEFDVTKIMFSSGNVDERERMKNLDCDGETVVDMFAGIGYFTLPIAKFAGPETVVACEKNPQSFGFLKRNVELNGVSETVRPILGDNRDIPGTKFADRILMGYVQRTSEFVPKALEMIKDGGTIHYHDTFYVNEYRERIDSVFSVCDHEILGIREVKSFAPSVSHYVADVRVTRTRRNPTL